MPVKPKPVSVAFPSWPFKGERRLRVALLGMPNSGTRTLFDAVAATHVDTGDLGGTHAPFQACRVQFGVHEADLIALPALPGTHHLPADALSTLKYLLWGNQLPLISAHDPAHSPAPFGAPDVIVQVIDATSLHSHLELTLELSQLGRPMVIALNMMDQVRDKGMHIDIKRLQAMLGISVVPVTGNMGQGITQLFDAVVRTAQHKSCPLPQSVSSHLVDSLQPLNTAIQWPEIQQAFRVAHPFLLYQLAVGDQYFIEEFTQHFPDHTPALLALRAEASQQLPRALEEEIHADWHHRAANIKEAVTRIGAPHAGRGWSYWLDELFLHPRWGLIGSMLVFATVLFVVFKVSSWLDAVFMTWLITPLSGWQPDSAAGVVGRGIADGLVGLVGIVVPYMIPLVLLLVALEESGIMHRIAFIVDRWFHHIGLHGSVAVPFLLGLGCNVPALSATALVTEGRQRLIASVLVTFVPCSARSAVILAIAGKYLGGLGVFAIFMITLLVIALLGQVLKRYFGDSGPGQIQDIPAYAWPHWQSMLTKTADRTRDILTIVTPLLVGGSVVLALMTFFGGDTIINTLLTPVSVWWLGLPVILGVPILFGILRKELSLLMIYQALGTFDVGLHLDWVQIMTFLIFLSFYVPCISTFAVMLKTIGRRQAFISIGISVSAALLVSGAVRLVLEVARYLIPSSA